MLKIFLIVLGSLAVLGLLAIAVFLWHYRGVGRY